MNGKKKLNFIVKTDPSSASFDELIQTTVGSIVNDPAYRPEDTGICITGLCDREELEKKCDKALEKGFDRSAWTVLPGDAVGSIVPGFDYHLLMESGDILKEKSMPAVYSHADSGEYGLVYFSRAIRTSGKKQSLFQSCAVETSAPMILKRGIMVRSDICGDLNVIISGGLRGTAEVIRSTIRTKGYYFEYEARYSEGTDNEQFAMDPAVMKDLIAYAEEVYPGGVTYCERCIILMSQERLGDAEALDTIRDCLALVSDKTILAGTALNFHEKRHLLRIKYGSDIMENVTVRDDGSVIWNGYNLFNVSARSRFRYTILDIEDDTLRITGATDLNMLGPGYRIFISEDNGNKIYLDFKHDPVRDIKSADGELLHEAKQFDVVIPLRDKCDFEVILEDSDGRQIALVPRMGKFSHLVDWLEGGYYTRNGYIIRPYYGKLYIEKTNKWKNLKAECTYLGRLLELKKPKVAVMRMAHFAYHLGQRKPVWLVADRPHIANDNGEHFFRYLMNNDIKNKKDIRFVLQKDSKDYPRVSSIGPVLDYGSFRHKMKYFEAEKIISAAANDLETMLLGGSQGYYRNICNFDFTYLRHGVAKDDQSRWLNKQGKNIRTILSTSTREHDAIVAGNYGYTEREVKLTGLPRFDNLYDERQKKITILPTWRKNIEGGRIKGSAEREYILDFRDTDYFKFYNSLINDERLLAKMKELGFTGSFYLHPVLEKQASHFKGNDIIEVGTTVADYQTVFRESSIMVTDFSSVAFDFAYLKKPLIYSQFDEATFYQDHSWDRGYFTYREDGFGPITNTVDETVDALIHYMENGCQMEDIYVKRVEDFFPYTDRNNCERVFNAIMETEK